MKNKNQLGISVILILALTSGAWGIADDWNWDLATSWTPDNVVPGSYINLGQTGLRVQLVQDGGTELTVKYVWSGSPADGKIQVGDVIIGANGSAFVTPHTTGSWGWDNSIQYGYDGPWRDAAVAIENSEAGSGALTLSIQGESDVVLNLDPIGGFSATFPYNCPKSDQIVNEALAYLAQQQEGNGSWRGEDMVVTPTAALALLASGQAQYDDEIKEAADYCTSNIKAYNSGLHMWRLGYWGVFLSEYYIKTGDVTVLPGLRELRKGARRMSSPRGWVQHLKVGDPDQGGYNEMSLGTGHILLTEAILGKCGFVIDPTRMEALHDYLYHSLSPNGYMHYEASVTPWLNNADFGRTATAAMANYIADLDASYQADALLSASFIGAYPEWWTETHGSALTGMTWVGIACAVNNRSDFRDLMDYCKYWITSSRTGDGSFVMQPTRCPQGMSGYGGFPREYLTAIIALIFSMEEAELLITGADRTVPGITGTPTGDTLTAYNQVGNEQYGAAWNTLSGDSSGDADIIRTYLTRRTRAVVDEMQTLHAANDLYGLQQWILDTASYAGIGMYDQAKTESEVVLQGGSAPLIATGQTYYNWFTAIEDDGFVASLDNLNGLETFGDTNSGNEYGPMAHGMVDFVWNTHAALVPCSLEEPYAWRYVTSDPGGSWTTAGYDDSGWSVGDAGFGDSTSTSLKMPIRTNWSSSDIWLRHNFTLDKTVWEARLYGCVNAEIYVYLNGTEIFNNASVGWGANTYYRVQDVISNLHTYLNQGDNVLAVRATDTGGDQWVDMVLTTRSDTGVTNFNFITNSPPVAESQTLDCWPDQGIPVTLGATDPDGQTVSYNVASQPSQGQVTGTAPNVTYTADPAAAGTDSFTFTASDGGATSVETVITIDIQGGPPIAPTVINSAATNITYDSARLNGQVTSSGGENPTVTIYWGDNDGGTTPGNWDYSEAMGIQGGGFYQDLSSLASDTTFYFRCYASNSSGSDWADSTESFATLPPPNAPTVVNSGATALTSFSATLNGEVTDTGGDTPTVTIYRGDNDGGTTPGNWDNTEGMGLQGGVFNKSISSLNPETTYYFRCYASNVGGIDWADSTAQFDTLSTDIVPDGAFETIYKPGQTTITATITGWTQGVGLLCPIDDGVYSFSDASTGTLADIPGWVGYDRDGWITWGGTYGRDQTTGNLQGSVSAGGNHTTGGAYCYLANGAGWGNAAGGLITSESSFDNIQSGATYTLSMYAKGSATPVVLELLADGVILTPTSEVSPTLTASWQEFTRTYDAGDLTSYVGQALTIVCGLGRDAVDTQTMFDDVSLNSVGGGGDTDPPTPDPATFASAPAAVSDTAITMTATTGSDASGPVMYYFNETSGNPGATDSGWTTNPVYNDTGLDPDTQYTYTVQMRDSIPNTGAASSPANATTDAEPDTSPPTPDPATFASAPAAVSDTEITMTATTGTDASGPVEYYFDETSGNPGGTDSGWTTNPVYNDTGLTASTQYTYTVQMRDSIPNTGTASAPANATTDPPPDTDPPTPDPATFSSVPAAVSSTEITMTAYTGSDASGPVQYYFDETSGNPGATDSGWTTDPVYNDTGLDADTQYTYTVTMRDALLNTGAASSPANATTDPPQGALPWSEDFESGSFTAGGWTTTGSASVSDKVGYSGTYGAKIPKIASIETAISTAGFTSIHVKYRRETRGFDSGENLIVEWYDGSSWNPLETVEDCVYEDGLQDKTCGAGADNNASFKIRFRTNTGNASEYASIDDIEVTGS